MCDTIAANLAATNVYGVNDVMLLTGLQTECESQTTLEAFNNYCLFPTILEYGNICRVDDKTDPDFLFTQMQSGNIDELTELPQLFLSAPAVVDATDDWVGGITADTFDFMAPQSTMVVKPSGGATNLMGWKKDENQIYMAGQDGVWYKVVTTSPPQLFTDITTDGTLRVMATQNVYYWWQAGKWTKGINLPGATILAIRVWQSGGTYFMAIISRDGISDTFVTTFQNNFVTPLISESLQTTTNNWSNAMISPQSGSDLAKFFISLISVSNAEIYFTWTTVAAPLQIAYAQGVSSVPLFFVTQAGEIVASGSTRGEIGVDANFRMRMYVPHYGYYDYTMPADSKVAPTQNDYDNDVQWGISGSIGNQFQTRVIRGDNPSLRVINNNVESDVSNLSLFANPNLVWSFYVDPAASILVLCYGDTIYTNVPTATDGTGWTTDNSFNIWKNVSVSDIGTNTLSTPQYNPGPQWFMGTYTNTIEPAYNVTLTSSTYYSFHQRYRILATVSAGLDSKLPEFTPIIRTPPTLQRSNERNMIQNTSNEARLYNDGNVKIIVGADEKNVVWENTMHDKISADDVFQVIDRTRPTVSQNGNYLTFWASDNTFQEVYYPYNNLRFREFGALSDTIFANSIAAQQEFCYKNLQMNPDNPLEVKFADGRCTCIGGEILFNRVFANVELLPAAQRSLLLQNFPCMMIDCTKTRTNFEPTNTFKLLAQKCLLPITICSNIISTEGNAAIGSININQECGGTDVTCSLDSDCSFGEKCSRGNCYQTCLVAGDCKTVGSGTFDCIDGLCQPQGSGTTSYTGLSVGAIAGIVVAVVVVIVITAVLLWYFLVKKPAMARAAGKA